jgi:hypothetical protein
MAVSVHLQSRDSGAIGKSKGTRKLLAGLRGIHVFSSGRMATATIAVELLPDRWRDFVGHGRGRIAGQDRQGQDGRNEGFHAASTLLAVTSRCVGNEGVVPRAGKVCQLWLRSTRS